MVMIDYQGINKVLRAKLAQCEVDNKALNTENSKLHKELIDKEKFWQEKCDKLKETLKQKP